MCTRAPHAGSVSNSAVFWCPRRCIPRIKLEKLVKNSIRDSASYSYEPGSTTFTVVACAVQGMGTPDIVGGIVCHYLIVCHVGLHDPGGRVQRFGSKQRQEILGIVVFQMHIFKF